MGKEQQGGQTGEHDSATARRNQAFKSFVENEFRRTNGEKTREEIIRDKLNYEAEIRSYDERTDRRDWERAYFFGEVLLAWDALAYDRYEIGSEAEKEAASFVYDLTKSLDKPVVILKPTQLEMLDALITAAGMPSRGGMTEVPVPTKLHRDNYKKWIRSTEYQAASSANAAKRTRK